MFSAHSNEHNDYLKEHCILMAHAEIGILGGSGLYRMAELKNPEEVIIDTPYGAPSDAILTGLLDNIPVAFLARHGRSHGLLPFEVPYRANIYALKSLGVKYLLSFSAVGSLQEQAAPLDMVIPDQYIDMTKKRESTFFGEGLIAHVSMAQPVCNRVADILAEAIAATPFGEDINLHRGGTYLCMEGPQFSSLAESNWYRSMGATVIGMTNMPEAKLAREAQIAYASLTMVTDYDCWHPKESHVNANMALANLLKNAERAQHIALEAVRLLNRHQPVSDAHNALDNAIVTPREAVPENKKALYDLLTR
jgi:5'-methylthioadenosine phosphorylase